MKKFIIAVSIIAVLFFAADAAYYRLGWYIDLGSSEPVSTFVRTDEDRILMRQGSGEFEEFEIKGVDLGSGKPGEWSTDFALDKETYLRWFKEIQDMGANTIRIYTIQQDVFYDAFYEYNKGNENPLWLIHGLWVNDYIQNSHRDAYDKDFYDKFISDSRTLIDVIHGNKKISLGRMASAGSGTYNKDISSWVTGYILGVEWEDVTVVYTDHKYADDSSRNSFRGQYMYTYENATPFESMLASVGDKLIEYETERYNQQRLVAFSNWPTTDPFVYPEDVSEYFMKCAQVDTEHIKCTEKFLSGQFASYHVYPYYPDYLSYVQDWSPYGIESKNDYYTESGSLNTYRAYLKMLTVHHTMPVVISEFGVSTGRGMAHLDVNTGRNQGNMSEKDQGRAIAECYDDIKSAGCAGSCVFSWQDEWFKRTWNTMYAVNLKRDPYWSDYQTNEQYFGLLSFDPGEEKSVCYVDGDISEWNEDDILTKNGSTELSVKYDEKFMYFLVKKAGFDKDSEKIYIPIDTTQKTGSTYCENNGLSFDRAADFIITIDGTDNSRVTVQERYEVLRSTYSEYVNQFDTYLKDNIPSASSPLFKNIDMILQTASPLAYLDPESSAETFETGKLTYGNANPESDDFNSLADFCINGDYIEIKIPWQLLNFSDPSKNEIHDDYYDNNYGIEHIYIDSMYLGVSDGTDKESIHLEEMELEGWDNDVTYHERLKSSYYILQSIWRED